MNTSAALILVCAISTNLTCTWLWKAAPELNQLWVDKQLTNRQKVIVTGKKNNADKFAVLEHDNVFVLFLLELAAEWIDWV